MFERFFVGNLYFLLKNHERKTENRVPRSNINGNRIRQKQRLGITSTLKIHQKTIGYVPMFKKDGSFMVL
jgi:hypothetical protein